MNHESHDAMNTETALMEPGLEDHPVVSRQEWLRARKELLKGEKELTRFRDRLAAQRRELPWLKVEKDYTFHGPEGPLALADLFRGRSQLIVYHFMFDPAWDAGCPGCSFLSDHVDGARLHFENHDVAYTAISRAPLAKLEAYKARMGWKFPWVSSEGSDFNYDFGVSFTEEQVAEGDALYNYERNDEAGECPGISVFYRDDAGEIFHTYSSYGRGPEEVITAFMLMDMTPKGRNETDTMDWVKRHDEYAASGNGTCCGG